MEPRIDEDKDRRNDDAGRPNGLVNRPYGWNQELTKTKIEGVIMELARMGQLIDHMNGTKN
jgi:hypothetical protein